MNLSKVQTSIHCGKYVSKVKERVQSILRTDADVEQFYKYLQFRNEADPENTDLCSVKQLRDFCVSIECPHCFRRVHNAIAHSFGESDAVPIDFLGPNPLEAIARFVGEGSSDTSRFLPTLHDAIDMFAERCVPVGPQYGIGTFIRNLKVILDQTVDLRWDAKKGDVEVLETVTDEQNQYISMMADCVSEFVTEVFKFETTRPFRTNACVFVQALVGVFEKLCTTLFNTCHKVRERLHRADIPSIVNVNMRGYMDAYKQNVDAAAYKSAQLALHILNLQRVEAFRVFYTEACDQIVMFDAVFARECNRLWKYVDQEDFLLPWRDCPLKTLLIAQLELGLGPLFCRSAEYTKGPYPTVLQELSMLEMRCAKLQQGHLEIWTRTRDRVLEQIVPDQFALTDAIRTDIQTASDDAVRICTMAVQEFTGKVKVSTPMIERALRTDALEGLRLRCILRMANLRMMCEFSFGLRHLSGLASFLHDYHPAIQERVCGTDFHVQLFLKNFILETHIQMLLDSFNEHLREEYIREIVKADSDALEKNEKNEKKCVRSVAKKNKPAKQKKMELNAMPNPPAAAAAVALTTPVQELVDNDDDSAWQEVRSKKKYAPETLKAHKNERPGGKSHTQTKKSQSTKSPASTCSSHSHPPPSHPHRTSTGGGRNRNRACSPNPRRVAQSQIEPEPVREPEPEPEPVREPEPEPVREPEPEPVREPEPEPVRESEPEPVRESEPNTSPVPKHDDRAAVETNQTQTQPQQCKRERRRGARARKQQADISSHVLNQTLFSTSSIQVDPLILASYAASQVSQPVQLPQLTQTVAVPARLFGGVLPHEYASVPFMTFPRVYV
jgi:hypothetical protein